MSTAAIILLLQIMVPVLLFFIGITSNIHSSGVPLLGTIICLLASPWVFRLRDVQDNDGLKIAAIAVVVASYLLFLLLIPILLMVITMV